MISPVAKLPPEQEGIIRADVTSDIANTGGSGGSGDIFRTPDKTKILDLKTEKLEPEPEKFVCCGCGKEVYSYNKNFHVCDSSKGITSAA